MFGCKCGCKKKEIQAELKRMQSDIRESWLYERQCIDDKIHNMVRESLKKEMEENVKELQIEISDNPPFFFIKKLAEMINDLQIRSHQ